MKIIFILIVLMIMFIFVSFISVMIFYFLVEVFFYFYSDISISFKVNEIKKALKVSIGGGAIMGLGIGMLYIKENKLK
ncbi:hypothetical protein [Proteus terrae]|uniref:hypothetical protein n=1 Tax=Proteus terrae TaxID=1574161 RepID=UPI00288A32B9|nr:hypothetical protein [Proteus terrae]